MIKVILLLLTPASAFRLAPDFSASTIALVDLSMVNSFKAVKSLKPVQLPDNIVITNPDDDPMDNIPETTFSIVFSPSGKLVKHDVLARNRDGAGYSGNPLLADESMDDMFNTPDNLANNLGMFEQDTTDVQSVLEFAILDTNQAALGAEAVSVNIYTGMLNEE